MKPNEYIKLCCLTGGKIIPKTLNGKISEIMHGTMGCVTESGELMDQLKKHLVYDKELDEINIKEELGDLSWYISIMLKQLNSSWEEIWEMNIAKLKKRFPNKFTKEDALNRDLEAERLILNNGNKLSNTTYFYDLTKEKLKQTTRAYRLSVAEEFGFKFKWYHPIWFIDNKLLKIVEINNKDKKL